MLAALAQGGTNMAYQKNKQRYEFIDEMFEKLDAVPVSQVIGRYIDLQKRGAHHYGLCPFHTSPHMGSFVVSDNKNIWKCFACGDNYGGNSMKFVSLYTGMNYLDAGFETAKDLGLISTEEYEKYAKKQYQTSYVEKLRKQHEAKQRKNKPVYATANKQIIHNVYQVIKNHSPLSSEHRQKLMDERKLPEDRINEDYFTFPVNRKGKIISAIRKTYPTYTDEILMTVPGFYINRETEKLSFTGYRGLGILIRDENGFISGIQIRRDTISEGDQRYVWFASTFAIYNQEKYRGGSSTGAPVDVLPPYPSAKAKNILCITEGRFKSEKLAAAGNISLSVQGVTTWHGISEKIAAIIKMRTVSKVFVFFDSDMLGNHTLFEQSIKMLDTLKKEYPDISFFYAIWKKQFGKGIDDCIIAGNVSRVQYVNPELCINKVNHAFHDTLTKYGLSKLQDLPKDVTIRLQFRDDLQHAAEDALEL